MPVVFLCHCDGTNLSQTFIDSSPSARTQTVTGAGGNITSTTPKFGSGCAQIVALGLIRIGNPQVDFNFGSGQFTVEAWAYFTATPTGVQAVAAQFGGASNLGWFFGTLPNLSFTYSTTGTDNPSVGAAYTPTLNTWIHLAVDRDASNVLRVYANGVVIASATVSASIFASTQQCVMGNDLNGTRAFPGRLDEVRITKGTAWYAGAFTPPTAPFPDGATSTQGPRIMVLA